jgi:hypothetical protein
LAKAHEILTGDDAKMCCAHEGNSCAKDVLIGTEASPWYAPIASCLFECLKYIGNFLCLDKDSCAMLTEEQHALCKWGFDGEITIVGTGDLIECATRWMWMLRALRKTCRLKSALIALYNNVDVGFYDALTEMYPESFLLAWWVELEQYEEPLLALEEMIVGSQSKKHPTISSLLFWIWQMKEACNPISGDCYREDDKPRTTELKKGLLRSYNRQLDYYFTTCNNALKASALDPWFANVVQFGVSQEMADIAWESISTELIMLSVAKDRRDSVAPQYAATATEVRNLLEKTSKEFLVQLKYNKPIQDQLHSMCPLQFWHVSTTSGDLDTRSCFLMFSTGV